MFYAAMIAAAFALDDPLAVVEAGLAEIPTTSRLYAAAERVIAICRQYRFQSEHIEEVHSAIYEAFGDDDMSTPNNMAMIVSALLMGGRDFEKVITYTVMGGFDCDCTAATAGSIAGSMLGAGCLPDKWIGPLHDTLYGQIAGYHPIGISELARRSVEIAQRVLGRG
jgi:ADP-ribosylglycohydrolase